MTATPVQAVVFDCDSTLSTVEGIDELARRAGVYEACCELTHRAMEGGVPLEAVYGQRLEMIRPDKAELAWLGQHYVAHITQGAREIVHALQERGIPVYIVSGGLQPAVEHLAAALEIAPDNVFAVDIRFDTDGQYAGFDAQSPLARSGGKGEVIRRLVADGKSVACVGDGITDLEMKMDGVLFIGFGGVKSRAVVKQNADIFVEDLSLLGVLPHLLPPADS